MRRYEILHPNARPIGIKFKEEDIYLKRFLCKLNGKARWRKHKREVKKGEAPAKQIKKQLGTGVLELFGYW